MKNRSHYFKHLFLSITLLVSSLTPPVASAQTDPTLDQQKTECQKNTSMEWSAAQNRCVGKVDAVKTRHEVDECNAKKTIVEREACNLNIAKASFAECNDPKKTVEEREACKIKAENSSTNLDKIKSRTTQTLVMNSAYAIVTGLNLTGSSNATSSCFSKKIFGITSVGGMLSDIYLKIQAKNKVEELNNKFSLGLAKNASDSQTKALEYLKDEQKTVIDIAEKEKKRNMILTIGYGAAAIVAVYELATFENNPDCVKPEEKSKTRPAETTVSELKSVGTTFSTVPSGSVPMQKAITSGAKSLLSKIRTFTDSSAGILLLSSIGTIYSGILWSAAEDQVHESEDNITKIDKLLATFKDSYANFCPNGHDSLNEPKCYCYTEGGKQNADRTKSQTCIDLWAKDTYKLAADKGNYAGVAKFNDAAGCVNTNGQFDEKCACKKFVDSKGSNACMKTTNINIPTGLGASFATGSGLQQVTNFSNNSANGNPGLDLLNSAQLASNAIAAQKMGQAIISKLAPNLTPNTLALTKMNESNVDKFAKAAFGDKAMAAAAAGSSSAIGAASSRSGDDKITSMLKDAEKKAGLDLIGGKGLSNKKADTKEGFNLNLGSDSSGNASAQMQNFPETQKNYNYKNSDISKRADTSIFEIISNRYVQSGLKRLFEEN